MLEVLEKINETLKIALGPVSDLGGAFENTFINEGVGGVGEFQGAINDIDYSNLENMPKINLGANTGTGTGTGTNFPRSNSAGAQSVSNSTSNSYVINITINEVENAQATASKIKTMLQQNISGLTTEVKKVG